MTQQVLFFAAGVCLDVGRSPKTPLVDVESKKDEYLR
jgi:hypothetical protein